LLSLTRNIGSAVGISITEALVTHNTQVQHEALSKFVTPLNRTFDGLHALGPALSPTTSQGQQVLNGLINQQAQIVAYNDDFKLMMLTSLPMLFLLLLMRRPRNAGGGSDHAAVMD